MTHLKFEEWSCRNARAKLDSYIDQELLTETNLEMVRHVQACGDCAQEEAARRELRSRLRAASRAVPAPVGLEDRVRARLKQEGRSKKPWSLMAIAAVITLCFLSWFTYERQMLLAGVDDHFHCAIIRQTLLKPVGQDKLPPKYKPVLEIARRHVPAGMHLAVAHQCTASGRKFVHVTFQDERRVLSVIVTKRAGWEKLPAGLHTGKIDGYEAAGFETGGYLVYTVSDLPKEENLRVLAGIAPGVRDALSKADKA